MAGSGLFAALEEVFGADALAPAVFYRRSAALRFELAGGATYAAQFLQAIDRTRSILSAGFAGAGEVTAVLEVWSDNKPAHLYQPDKLWQKTEAALRGLGLQPPKPEHKRLHTEAGDWPRNSFAFTLPTAQVDELLWGILAHDLGVTPSLPARLILAAPELGVLASPYDSRGMDMVGPNEKRLAQLYREFNGWLLDYDRPRMDESFKPLQPV